MGTSSGFVLYELVELRFGLTQEAIEPLLLLLGQIAGRLQGAAMPHDGSVAPHKKGTHCRPLSH